jgi:hypothetical protein
MLKLNYYYIRVTLTGCGSFQGNIVPETERRPFRMNYGYVDPDLEAARLFVHAVTFNRTLCEPSKMSKKPASSTESDNKQN